MNRFTYISVKNNQEIKELFENIPWEEHSPGHFYRKLEIKTKFLNLVLRESATFCMDCRKDLFDVFLVKKRVWKEAGFIKYNDGLICLKCIKKRLKRPLTKNDFVKRAKCNEFIFLT